MDETLSRGDRSVTALSDEVTLSSEARRYFPEWANRPTREGAQRECDRNSYLAGGYADEFGYLLPPGGVPAIAPLDGAPEPERCELWRAQTGALHPGYPECPKPVELDPGCVADAESMGAAAPASCRRAVGRGEAPPVESRRGTGSAGRMQIKVVGSRERDRAGHRDAWVGFGVLSRLRERKIRRHHLNDVL